MKKILLFIALFLGSTVAYGQAKGWWEPFAYYDNNPALFCTLGVPWEGWVPIDPAQGTFMVTNYYDFNPVSAAQYARGCPWGFKAGGLGLVLPVALPPRARADRHA